MIDLHAGLIITVLTTYGFSPAALESRGRLKPINLDGLNTTKDEDDPHVTSSGMRLFYATNANKKWDIFLSRRTALNQAWPAGKPLGDYIQTEVDDRSVFLTTDGRYPQYLYFATKKDKEINNFDIYVAVKHNAKAAYTSPTPLSTISTRADELHPWLTANGQELYFSRKTKDGWRVYVAKRQTVTGGGGFRQPRLVEELSADFHHATLAPDGKTMYLQGALKNDRWGLFRSTLSGASWSQPEPLDDLNDPAGPTGDRSPCLSRDGQWLYFTSDRPGGKGGLDLYMIRTNELKK